MKKNESMAHPSLIHLYIVVIWKYVKAGSHTGGPIYYSFIVEGLICKICIVLYISIVKN